MSGGNVCICKGKREDREKNWIVEKFKCNHSAFSGYRETRSDYSAFRCLACSRSWRSKADYVYRILSMKKKSTNEN